MKTLWIMDPWMTLDHPRETTLRLIEAQVNLGMKVYWAASHSLALLSHKGQSTVTVEAQQFLHVDPERESHSFEMSSPRTIRLDFFSQVHYRCDPPVNQTFFHQVQILKWAQNRWPRLELVNSPEALLLTNEKFGGLEWGPHSVVSSSWEGLKTFGQKHGTTVLKPLALAQSQGVEKITWKAASASALEGIRKRVSETTQGFKLPVLLQNYEPAIQQGEDRIWFVDGKAIAAVRKWPIKGDFRVQIDLGSQIKPTVLSAAQKKVATKVGQRLAKLGVRLAAVDFIGATVIDFNVTSPGLLVQMEQVLQKDLSTSIVKQLRRRPARS